MSEKLRLYAKILKAELEDLEEDLESWGKFMEAKHREQKITEYVFLENTALLRQELRSVQKLVDKVGEDKAPGVTNLEGLRDHFRALFEKAVQENQFPQAVLGFVLRKVDKVYEYLKV